MTKPNFNFSDRVANPQPVLLSDTENFSSSGEDGENSDYLDTDEYEQGCDFLDNKILPETESFRSDLTTKFWENPHISPKRSRKRKAYFSNSSNKKHKQK